MGCDKIFKLVYVKHYLVYFFWGKITRINVQYTMMCLTVMWSEVNKKREFCILGTRFFIFVLQCCDTICFLISDVHKPVDRTFMKPFLATM